MLLQIVCRSKGKSTRHGKAGFRRRIKVAVSAKKIGKVLSGQDEAALLSACRASRSRSINVAVVLSLHTGMRYSELRLLRWQAVDFSRKTITVGVSKTEAGEGRVLHMTRFVLETLKIWADRFPSRKAADFLFPSEKYGQGGKVYSIEPTRPIGTWKYAWRFARKASGIPVRFHDLRHTFCTRLLESGCPFAMVPEIMGWSPATTVLMMKRYGHVSPVAKQNALEAMEQHLSTLQPSSLTGRIQ